MKKIKVWKYWEKNWDNAKRFFDSKGDIDTKAKLKKKWHDDFMKMFKEIEEQLKKEKGRRSKWMKQKKN